MDNVKMEEQENSLEQMLQTLVAYVHKHESIDGGWCVITQRDVPRLTGSSTFAARKLLEMLKQHANIVYEIDETRASRKKPFRFRFVTEEEKKDIGIPDDGFYYLSEQEVRWVKNIMRGSSYYELHAILSFLNVMALSGSKENFALTVVKDLTRYCRDGEKEARRLIALLKDHRLVVEDPNAKELYYLQLSEEALAKGSQLIEQSNKRTQLAALPLSQIAKLEKEGLSIADTNVPLKNEFEKFIKTFQELSTVLQKVDEGLKGNLDNALARYSWLNAKEEELEKSYRITTALMDENNSLKATIEEKDRLLDMYANSLSKNNEWLDTVAVTIAQRIDGLQAELLQEIEGFMRTPSITIGTCNAFKQKIIKATIDASREIGLAMVKKPED